MKKLIVVVLLCIPMCMWLGSRIYKEVIFNIECEGRIKRAADANTVELATKEMETAVSYAEKQGLTSGYTSILYRTPDEDVEFWYQNLKASLTELKNVKPEATQLEKSNVLMKLRETLLDSSSSGKGMSVTAPEGIAVFPHNVSYMLTGLVSFVLLILGVLVGTGVMEDIWELD